MLIFYFIKHRKAVILHRWSLNFPNRNEGEQYGDEVFLFIFFAFFTILQQSYKKPYKESLGEIKKKVAEGETLNPS